MSTDPALAVAYMRLNGCFLVTEQELHIREPVGFRALTDIDIIALRPPTAPGPPHHRLGQGVEESLIVTDVDPALDMSLLEEFEESSPMAPEHHARFRQLALSSRGWTESQCVRALRASQAKAGLRDWTNS